jgi:membrane-bound metal-dependent hydrolase YbcI (DUF457 family)
MPFTPLHLGPVLLIGLPLKNRIHAPTFIIANIAVDIEPFLIIVLGLRLPLYGYLHTFLVTSIYGALLATVMYAINPWFSDIYETLKINPRSKLKFINYVIAGIAGCIIHVLLDSPLYYDIRPLYPLNINPFFNPAMTVTIYQLTGTALIIGIIIYLVIILKETKRNYRTA